MLRKILLAGIMVVSVAIIMVALQSQRAEFDETDEEDEPERTGAARKLEDKQEPIRLEKYDNQHNLVAVITGEEAEQKGEGPVHIVKPTIRILRDPNRITVITADTGYLEGTDKKRMGEGWLRGNVVMTVLDRINDDNTVLTCRELQ